MDELSIDADPRPLRGAPKTDVTVTIKRGDTVAVRHDHHAGHHPAAHVKYTMIPGGIGYLRMSEFTPQTGGASRQALRSFMATGYTSLILDLRGNPGGLLTAAVDVANLFIDQGLIVETEERAGGQSENMIYNARQQPHAGGPADPRRRPRGQVLRLRRRDRLRGAEGLSPRHPHRGEDLREGIRAERQALGDGGFRLTTSRYYTLPGPRGSRSTR